MNRKLNRTRHPRLNNEGSENTKPVGPSGGFVLVPDTITTVSAVLYTRVSTDEQSRRNAANLPTQEKKCLDHCAREGLRVVRVFVDKESARTTNWEQLQELLSTV
jgi:hypothetical protein